MITIAFPAWILSNLHHSSEGLPEIILPGLILVVDRFFRLPERTMLGMKPVMKQFPCQGLRLFPAINANRAVMASKSHEFLEKTNLLFFHLAPPLPDYNR
ncbi:MAG: hypothetical protein DRH11_13135 [Deltaproteobacteria bacterium]|nr:MAG: hypothetical protein DRH11_13135 [Deltaproteobacteria bacterium]